MCLLVTDRCNLKCRYCPRLDRERMKELDTALLCRLIDDLVAGGMRFCAITGGEPLLRNDIGIIIRHVKSAGIVCTLATNGWFVPDKIDDLAHLDSISISLDGPMDIHDSLRGWGSFEKAMDAVRILVSRGIKTDLTMVLNRANVDQVERMADLARDIGAWIKYCPMHHEYNHSAYELPATDESLRKAIKTIAMLKRNGFPVRLSASCYELLNAWPDLSNPSGARAKKSAWPIKCLAGYLRATVNPDGTMSPCFFASPRLSGLNCLEVGVANAMEHVRDNNKCLACCDASMTEFDIIFSGRLRPLISNVADYFRRRPAAGVR